MWRPNCRERDADMHAGSGCMISTLHVKAITRIGEGCKSSRSRDRMWLIVGGNNASMSGPSAPTDARGGCPNHWLWMITGRAATEQGRAWGPNERRGICVMRWMGSTCEQRCVGVFADRFLWHIMHSVGVSVGIWHRQIVGSH